jgi:threonine synthase
LGTVTGLKCRECGREYDIRPIYMCEYCFGPLGVEYNMERAGKIMTRKRIRNGPHSLWRYRDLLPLESETPVDLHAGFTPLARADRLAKRIGIKNLYLKNECFNPTDSVKDRMVSVAVSKALEFKYDTVACASAGNMSLSLAAHAAAAGLRCVIFQSARQDATRMTGGGVYGAEVVNVDGTPAEVNQLCADAAARSRWAFINVHLRPFYAEGAKTIAFEIAEQMGYYLPGHVIAPMASGAMLAGMARGFREIRALGLVRGPETKISGAQAHGCSPIVKAFDEKTTVIRSVTPDTTIKSLSVGNPADGAYALQAIRDTGGFATCSNDRAIMECVRMLAETEGVYADPAGGAAIMALRTLLERKRIRVNEQVVLIIPARGATTPDPAETAARKPRTIPPSMAALKELLEGMGGAFGG